MERGGAAIEIFSLLEPEEGLRHEALKKVRSPVTYLPQRATLKDLSVLEGSYCGGTFEPRWLKEAIEGENHKKEVFRYLQAAALAVLARSRGIAHFHAHFATDATTVAMLASRLTGIPYSFTAHAKDIYHEYVDQCALNEKIKGARFVITVSEYNRAHLASIVGETDSQKIIRLYNGIDLEQFQPDAAAQHGPSLILAVGRLVEKKGFQDLITACAHLQRNAVPFQCLIVGDGPERGKLCKAIAELDLLDSVLLMGPSPQEEVIRLLKRATVLVLPCVVSESTGDRDGLPTVLLEALAVGLPAISTRVAGIPEIIGHCDTGLLVAPRDPAGLANAIAEILADKTCRDLMGRQGRAKAIRDFDIRKNVPTLWRAFERSMSAKSEATGWDLSSELRERSGLGVPSTLADDDSHHDGNREIS